MVESRPPCPPDALDLNPKIPEATANQGSSYPWRRALPWLVLAVLLVVLRRPDAFLNPQFWAEDGSVFFVQAEGLGWRALIQPHVGYHHFAMRLWAGACVGAGVPVAWLPAMFVAGASIGWLAEAAFLFSPRARWRWPTAMLGALVLVPSANETWFNLTNLQWFLALLWPLWWMAGDPRTKAGVVAESAAMAVAGLTSVFSILAAPLMVWRAVRRRTGASIAAAVVCLAAAAIQFATAVADRASETPAAGAGVDWIGAMIVTSKRIWGGLFLPNAAGSAAMVWVGAVLGVAMIGAFAWAAWRSDRWRPLLGWLVFGGGVLAATVIRFHGDMEPLMSLSGGPRYFLVPQVLVLWGLIQVAAGAGRIWRMAAAALLIVALATAASRFRLPVLRDNDWPTWAARIEAGGDVGWVPIAPDGMRFYYSAPKKDR